MELGMINKNPRRDTPTPPIHDPLNGTRLIGYAEHLSDPLRPEQLFDYVDFRIHTQY